MPPPPAVSDKKEPKGIEQGTHAQRVEMSSKSYHKKLKGEQTLFKSRHKGPGHEVHAAGAYMPLET